MNRDAISAEARPVNPESIVLYSMTADYSRDPYLFVPLPR